MHSITPPANCVDINRLAFEKEVKRYIKSVKKTVSSEGKAYHLSVNAVVEGEGFIPSPYPIGCIEKKRKELTQLIGKMMAFLNKLCEKKSLTRDRT